MNLTQKMINAINNRVVDAEITIQLDTSDTFVLWVTKSTRTVCINNQNNERMIEARRWTLDRQQALGSNKSAKSPLTIAKFAERILG